MPPERGTANDASLARYARLRDLLPARRAARLPQMSPWVGLKISGRGSGIATDALIQSSTIIARGPAMRPAIAGARMLTATEALEENSHDQATVTH